MKKQKDKISELLTPLVGGRSFRQTVQCAVCGGVLLGIMNCVWASENVPHLPFAQWADVPTQGQFIAGLVYEESESYHIWAQHT